MLALGFVECGLDVRVDSVFGFGLARVEVSAAFGFCTCKLCWGWAGVCSCMVLCMCSLCAGLGFCQVWVGCMG